MQPMSETLQLVADIGASNARIASVSEQGMQVALLRTREFVDAAALFTQACRELGVTRISGCCVAVAGPVVDGIGAITNGQLEFSAAALSAQLDADTVVVNDFHALAMALPHLSSLQQVGGRAGGEGTRAVLGPGSGLGAAFSVRQNGRWLVLPSEAGHSDLAPGNMLELEVVGLLHQQFDRVCWEHVLSGPGLVNLYCAIAAIWGGKPDELTPEQISQRGLNAQDPVCHQTLELFLGWLGAAAGNLALTLCARGGVYIGGGIVPVLIDMVADSPLRRRFEERAGLEDFVKDIPVYVITEQYPGLVGALACLDSAAGQFSSPVRSNS